MSQHLTPWHESEEQLARSMAAVRQRTCGCAGGGHVRARLPTASNLEVVAAIAALSDDPVFRRAVKRAAFVVRGGAA